MLMYVRDNTVNDSGAYLMNCNKPIYRAAWETTTPNRRGLGNYDAVVLWRYVTAHALYWPGIVGSKSKVSMVSHVRCLKPQIISASKANIKDDRLKVYFLSVRDFTELSWILTAHVMSLISSWGWNNTLANPCQCNSCWFSDSFTRH